MATDGSLPCSELRFCPFICFFAAYLTEYLAKTYVWYVCTYHHPVLSLHTGCRRISLLLEQTPSQKYSIALALPGDTVPVRHNLAGWPRREFSKLDRGAGINEGASFGRKTRSFLIPRNTRVPFLKETKQRDRMHRAGYQQSKRTAAVEPDACRHEDSSHQNQI